MLTSENAPSMRLSEWRNGRPQRTPRRVEEGKGPTCAQWSVRNGSLANYLSYRSVAERCEKRRAFTENSFPRRRGRRRHCGQACTAALPAPALLFLAAEKRHQPMATWMSAKVTR